MGILNLMLLFWLTVIPTSHAAETGEVGGGEEGLSSAKPKWESNYRKVIDVKGGPESVVWVVQLSDLHFSVHHPDRAIDFKKIVGPALSMINPSLVLITGDLTGS